jgi:hypothetical protein
MKNGLIKNLFKGAGLTLVGGAIASMLIGCATPKEKIFNEVNRDKIFKRENYDKYSVDSFVYYDNETQEETVEYIFEDKCKFRCDAVAKFDITNIHFPPGSGPGLFWCEDITNKKERNFYSTKELAKFIVFYRDNGIITSYEDLDGDGILETKENH